PQAETVKLTLTGKTAYDPDAMVKIRLRFNALINGTHVTAGEVVKKRQPLVDLFSAELAQAKADFQVKSARWAQDKRRVEALQSQAEKGASLRDARLDAQADEIKSRLEIGVARDKLLVYGLTEAEIEKMKGEDREQGAQMTLRSPIDGVVIAREVAP